MYHIYQAMPSFDIPLFSVWPRTSALFRQSPPRTLHAESLLPSFYRSSRHLEISVMEIEPSILFSSSKDGVETLS